MYKLHCFVQSGNAYKTAFFLNHLGVPWEPVFVDFMNGQTRTEPWRASNNDMGEAPVLEDGSRRLTQSAVILLYLARKHGRCGPKDEEQEYDMLRWLFFDNHKFTSFFAAHRFLKSFGPAAPDPAVLKFLQTRIDSAYGIVDKRLSTQPFMMGDAPTIVDFSLCGYCFYPKEETGYDLEARFPAIAAWVRRLQALPGWKGPYELMPGERIAPKW